MIAWPAKDPGETLDFTWIVPLDEGDTLASYTAAVAEGAVVKESDAAASGRVTIWLSGGADGEKALIALAAVTTGGRTFRETAVLPVYSRAAAVLADFRLRYPEFGSVDDGVVSYWLLDALSTVSGWCEEDDARLALTAHNLALQGHGTAGGAVGNLAAMGVTSFRSASMSVQFDGGTIASKSAGGYGSTRYGRDFLAYLRRCRGGPRLVGCA